MSAYLLAYNAISAAGWYYCLCALYLFISDPYPQMGMGLSIVQTAALLEIVHAALGLVKTPISTTVMQVSSRLLLVWGICLQFPQVTHSGFFVSMVTAWSITEIVRYSYYALSLASSVPYALLWCRYTFFFILYPIGAGSEWVLMYKSLSYLSGFYYYLVCGILAIYVPGFYVMYTHMIKQRRKYLGGKKPKKVVKKEE